MPGPGHQYNPFSKRETYSKNAITAYRVLTPISWLLVVVFGIFYSIHRPDDVPNGFTVWEQTHRNPTPFSQSSVVTGVFWIILLISQLGYIANLFSSNPAKVTSAANVAGFYILNNLFVLAFVLLWVRSKFWGAEIIDIANLISQGIVYWKHHDLPLDIHLPAVAGPYAWTLSTLFWNGAVAVGGDNTPKRIVANVFIWVMFVFGQGHIARRGDFAYGYSLSLLTLSLALKQFSLKIISLQWIFAFVIFGVFFVTSLSASVAKYHNRDFFFRSFAEPVDSTDRERQPLLSE
ncbi:conserved hypothetical protein [Histoplasma capsulatum var. duboisii H88]|uniref:DUF1774 domain-containing protein n=4 Tax=Ajellomyces capsulatus TaxID=5037 RepID=C0NVM1_AJECG|nr:uncharacterized protein HCBG_07201 [Histoplasma capsulatum G186AR]EER40156.1 conserved hypothetical protein [Histoplasma capsulatum H143]EGC48626.1 conserved hypothetical protein [Histoplasma capsulatum var. duboisii H88]KAG5296389.1 DUF1774 superfamily domain-containing protein [Histoplasma capsulatum]EEH04560.1 conserved hypothetical protein [Histoplasma capsulatum G186AR]QSS50635.1 DUF1774 superfamily domain-containing protein [Histoplasma capsulatum var. duboisii H88]